MPSSWYDSTSRYYLESIYASKTRVHGNRTRKHSIEFVTRLCGGLSKMRGRVRILLLTPMSLARDCGLGHARWHKIDIPYSIHGLSNTLKDISRWRSPSLNRGRMVPSFLFSTLNIPGEPDPISSQPRASIAARIGT